MTKFIYEPFPAPASLMPMNSTVPHKANPNFKTRFSKENPLDGLIEVCYGEDKIWATDEEHNSGVVEEAWEKWNGGCEVSVPSLQDGGLGR